MEQIWITEHGATDVLEVRSGADPVAAPGEIRIKVAAAGLNFADVSARVGLYADAPKPPMVVGYEVSGTVDQLGAGVESFALGDAVVALTRFGGHSSSVVVPVNQAFALPAEADVVHAAAMPVNYLTAYLMLVKLGSIREGDTVLIHAAAGGVGQAALQLCKMLGATTFGTASAAKHDRLAELGLDHPIDYRNKDFAEEVERLTDGRGVDVILDAVGGATSRKNVKLLAPLGRLFHFGISAASQEPKRNMFTAARTVASLPIHHPVSLMQNNRGVFGINLGHLWDETEMLGDAMVELLSFWEKGIIEPVIDSTFPFSEAAAAHDQLQLARNFGKVLLIP